MSKKYVPSGYQIINFSIPFGDVTGTLSDDVKEKIITACENNKPILLSIYDEDGEQTLFLYPQCVYDHTGGLDYKVTLYAKYLSNSSDLTEVNILITNENVGSWTINIE